MLIKIQVGTGSIPALASVLYGVKKICTSISNHVEKYRVAGVQILAHYWFDSQLQDKKERYFKGT